MARGTRSYLVQQVLVIELTSAKVKVLSRFVKFFQSLREAPSVDVRTAALLAARDLRTVTGRNVSLVATLSGEDPWTSSTSRVREALREREKVSPAPMDSWHFSYLQTLLQQRQEAHYEGLEQEIENITNLINSLWIN